MRVRSRLILLAVLAGLPQVQATLGAWREGGSPTDGGQLADAASQGTLLLEDAAGDVQARIRFAESAIPPGAWDAMDLVSLSAVEASDEIQFRLRVLSLRETIQDALLAAIEYEIVFRHGDQVYRAVASAPSEKDTHGFLERIPAGMDPDAPLGAQGRIAEAAVTIDVRSNLVLVSVPRDHLTDSQGVAPAPGAILDFFFVDAGYLNDEEPVSGNASGPFLEDRMPDTGMGSRAMPVTQGRPPQTAPDGQTARPRTANDEFLGVVGAEASTVVGAGLGLLLAARIGMSLLPFLVGAYARIVGADVLKHPVRRLLYDLIQGTPGADMPFLLPHVAIGQTTLRFHLRTLTSNGLVVAVRKGRSLRYFDSRLDADRRARKALMLNPGTAALVSLVRREPGLHLATVAARLGIRPPSALWHVRRAQEANLIQGRREGRFVRYFSKGDEPARSSAGAGS